MNITDPKITTSFSQKNTDKHKESIMQQALIQETNEIPKIPKNSFEQVEIVCEKGMCVRKPANTFGYSYINQKLKKIVVNKSNPFNL